MGQAAVDPSSFEVVITSLMQMSDPVFECLSESSSLVYEQPCQKEGGKGVWRPTSALLQVPEDCLSVVIQAGSRQAEDNHGHPPTSDGFVCRAQRLTSHHFLPECKVSGSSLCPDSDKQPISEISSWKTSKIWLLFVLHSY